jgi:hypothetical protein
MVKLPQGVQRTRTFLDTPFDTNLDYISTNQVRTPEIHTHQLLGQTTYCLLIKKASGIRQQGPLLHHLLSREEK